MIKVVVNYFSAGVLASFSSHDSINEVTPQLLFWNVPPDGVSSSPFFWDYMHGLTAYQILPLPDYARPDGVSNSPLAWLDTRLRGLTASPLILLCAFWRRTKVSLYLTMRGPTASPLVWLWAAWRRTKFSLYLTMRILTASPLIWLCAAWRRLPVSDHARPGGVPSSPFTWLYERPDCVSPYLTMRGLGLYQVLPIPDYALPGGVPSSPFTWLYARPNSVSSLPLPKFVRCLVMNEVTPWLYARIKRERHFTDACQGISWLRTSLWCLHRASCYTAWFSLRFTLLHDLQPLNGCLLVKVQRSSWEQCG